MTSSILIPDSCAERLRILLDLGWNILLRQIMSGRMAVNKEASLQLHYAAIVQQLGSTFCLLPAETFAIELESSIKDGEIDITCSLGITKAAIEMKCFRKRSNRAQDIDMYNVLSDIGRLQALPSYSVRKFLCLTDNPYYAVSSHRGHASSVSIKHGHGYKPDTTITPSWAGKWKSHANDAQIELPLGVRFDWTKSQGWYSLNIDV